MQAEPNVSAILTLGGWALVWGVAMWRESRIRRVRIALRKEARRVAGMLRRDRAGMEFAWRALARQTAPQARRGKA